MGWHCHHAACKRAGLKDQLADQNGRVCTLKGEHNKLEFQRDSRPHQVTITLQEIES